jgi:hypothetical protein
MAVADKMTRAQAVDAQLEEIYAQVPEIGCKGLCADACGPVTGGHRELVRMARAGVKLPPVREALRLLAVNQGDYRCPALKDGQCSTYEARPAICRVWGASEDLPCPYGCAPANGRLLTTAETGAILDAARLAGILERPVTAAQMERGLQDPRVRARRSYLSKPVATQNLGGTLTDGGAS